jgi:hypothetical protein
LILRLYRTLPVPRYTVDIDLLLKGRPMSSVRAILERAMAVDLGDGFRFRDITSEPMERDTPYGGDRYELGWSLYRKSGSQTLKIDVCAGDIVVEKRAATRDLFLMQSGNDLALNIYPPEFIFAEKLETAARFATGNSRFKDYIDMWSFVRSDLDRERVQSAVLGCFKNRGTACSWSDIREIMGDDDFVALMERVRVRSYAHLGLPPAAQMFADLLRYVETLHLPS